MNKFLSSLVLGTVQLGMPYGVANRYGQPDRMEALRIVGRAFQNGICWFDTAQKYGESEDVLGFCFKELGITQTVKVISKIDPEHIPLKIDDSLNKLGIDHFEGLLLHRGTALKEWESRYVRVFDQWKREGIVRHAGVSIYTEEEFEQALSLSGIQWIQLPFNVFDQRAIQRGWLERAQQKNKTIFIRSLFLQGLLSMDPKRLADNMSFAKPFLEKFSAFCREHQTNPHTMALAFVLKFAAGFPFLIGVEQESQLIENIDILNKMDETILGKMEPFPNLDVPDRLIHPSLWN